MSKIELTDEQKREWKERENQRFLDGTYTHLPEGWRYSNWWRAALLRTPQMAHHYPHVSRSKVSMIAFTENDQKGVRDRQTVVTPGRYLTKFFKTEDGGSDGLLLPESITYLATEFANMYNDDAELKFAVTGDEIVEVYKNGPNSCMDGRHSFDSPVHPTWVYGGKDGMDLQLAYLVRDGRITARALCWPEKKIYGRTYGDQVRLEYMLQQIGYSQESLTGARIAKRMKRDKYVIPYLDYMEGAIDRGDHLVLTDGSESGRTCCRHDRQNGLSGGDFECCNCGEEVDEDDCLTNDSGDRYCESCYDDYYGYCDKYGERVPRDDLREVAVRYNPRTRYYDWQSWCESARDEYAFYCDRADGWFATGICELVEGEYISPQIFYQMRDRGEIVQAAPDDEYWFTENTVTLHDDTIWSKDFFRRHGVKIDGVNYDKEALPEGVELPAEIKTEPLKTLTPSEIVLADPAGYTIEKGDNGGCPVYRVKKDGVQIDWYYYEANAIEAIAFHKTNNLAA